MTYDEDGKPSTAEDVDNTNGSYAESQAHQCEGKSSYLGIVDSIALILQFKSTKQPSDRRKLENYRI